MHFPSKFSQKNKKTRLKHAESMSEFLNENDFGTPDKPGSYHVPTMDEKVESLVTSTSMMVCMANKLELVLVKKVLPPF
jgi:hypothetical protein